MSTSQDGLVTARVLLLPGDHRGHGRQEKFPRLTEITFGQRLTFGEVIALAGQKRRCWLFPGIRNRNPPQRCHLSRILRDSFANHPCRTHHARKAQVSRNLVFLLENPLKTFYFPLSIPMQQYSVFDTDKVAKALAQHVLKRWFCPVVAIINPFILKF